MKTFERVIVTNNPSSAKYYGDFDKVMYMENATPFEVYSKVKDLLEDGGHLIRPTLKDKTDYFTTVGVFYDDNAEPTPWNMREIEAACRATMGISNFKKGSYFGQLKDRRKNGPNRRKAS